MAENFTFNVNARDRASEALDDIEGEVKDADEAVDKLGDTSEKTSEQSSTFASVLKADLAAEAMQEVVQRAAEAARALGQMTVQQAELNAKIQRSAEATGTSTQAYQELLFVLKRFGLGQKEVNEGLSTLSERATDAINGAKGMQEDFAALGITLSNLRGKRPAQLFELVANRIRKTENPTKRLKGAVALLGDELGNKLAERLGAAEQSFSEMREGVSETGQVLSDFEVRQAAAADKAVEDLTAQAGGLKRQLTAELAPGLRTVATATQDVTEGISDEAWSNIGELVETWADEMEDLSTSAGGAIGPLTEILNIAQEIAKIAPSQRMVEFVQLMSGEQTLGEAAVGAVPFGERLFGEEQVQFGGVRQNREPGGETFTRGTPNVTVTPTQEPEGGTTPGGAGGGPTGPTQRELRVRRRTVELEAKIRNLRRGGLGETAEMVELQKETLETRSKIRDLQEQESLSEAERVELQELQSELADKRFEFRKERREQEFEEEMARIQRRHERQMKLVDRRAEARRQALQQNARQVQQIMEGGDVGGLQRLGPGTPSQLRQETTSQLRDRLNRPGLTEVQRDQIQRIVERRVSRIQGATDVAQGAAQGFSRGAQGASQLLRRQGRINELRQAKKSATGDRRRRLQQRLRQERNVNQTLAERVELYGQLGSQAGKLTGAIGELAKKNFKFSNAQEATLSATSALSQAGGVASQFVEGTKKRAGVKAGFEAAASAAALAGFLASQGTQPQLLAASIQHGTAAGMFGAVASGAVSQSGTSGGAPGGAAAGGGGAGGAGATGGPRIDPEAQREKSAKAFARELEASDQQQQRNVTVNISGTHIGNTTPEIEESVLEGVERAEGRQSPTPGRG